MTATYYTACRQDCSNFICASEHCTLHTAQCMVSTVHCCVLLRARCPRQFNKGGNLHNCQLFPDTGHYVTDRHHTTLHCKQIFVQCIFWCTSWSTPILPYIYTAHFVPHILRAITGLLLFMGRAGLSPRPTLYV